MKAQWRTRVNDLAKVETLSSKQEENLSQSVIASFPNQYVTVVGRQWPLIPEGIYQAGYVKHDFQPAFGVPRVFVHFKILDMGEWFETVLYRTYRLESLKNPGRKNSAFRVGRRSDFVHEMALVTNRRVDRIRPNDFEGLLLKAKVATVTEDYKQRHMPKPLQYSVIREIIGKVDL